jgi:hypothetical protein
MSGSYLAQDVAGYALGSAASNAGLCSEEESGATAVQFMSKRTTPTPRRCKRSMFAAEFVYSSAPTVNIGTGPWRCGCTRGNGVGALLDPPHADSAHAASKASGSQRRAAAGVERRQTDKRRTITAAEPRRLGFRFVANWAARPDSRTPPQAAKLTTAASQKGSTSARSVLGRRPPHA